MLLLWDNFQNNQVQKFENQVFNTNLSSTPSDSYQNQVQKFENQVRLVTLLVLCNEAKVRSYLEQTLHYE